VRKLVAFVAAAATGFGFVRLLMRRRAVHAPPVEALADSRAAELRRKLEESRSLVGEREHFESGETTVDAADAEPADLDERRRAVHEEGRAAVERMRRPPG
jgi:hypothetical protein